MACYNSDTGSCLYECGWWWDDTRRCYPHWRHCWCQDECDCTAPSYSCRWHCRRYKTISCSGTAPCCLASDIASVNPIRPCSCCKRSTVS